MYVNRLTRNAIMAVLQVAVSGGILFLLYRYLLQTIGPEQVGIWAIVLAAASTSRISEMGFAGSAVKFTARYLARGDKNKASEVIQTTVITIGVVLACVLGVGYPFIVWLMGKIVSSTYIPVVLAILPYAMVSVWIGAVAGVFLSGLDGCQRVDLHALVSMLGGVIFLVLAWVLVPQYGLMGLAWGQIAQGVLMLLASWALLWRELPTLPMLPRGWRYSLFSEMFQYGVNFQVMGIAAMLYEPTTKALMAKFGGLTTTAYYEMANRMVMQFRSLLVSANQVMVPHVANLQETLPGQLRKAYVDSYRLLFFLAVPLFTSVTAVLPFASELWIGHYEDMFVWFSLLLIVGFGVNTLSGPAYFINLGTGLLRGNTIAHVVIGVVNIFMGYLLGVIFGGSGVAVGYVVALIAGSGLVIFWYHRDHHMPLMELFPDESRALGVACLVGLLTGWTVFQLIEVPIGPVGKAWLSFVICAVIISPALWYHPLRITMSSRVAVALSWDARN